MPIVSTKKRARRREPPLSIPLECVPDVTDIVIEDGAPVDGLISEKEMRLLTEPLYSSWPGPGAGRRFAVLANVGLFHTYRKPPIVPDVMLSLDVTWPEDLSLKEHNTYFVWVIGKLPEVALEVVSNLEGGEDSAKLLEYARIRIPYYVIYDPTQLLSSEVLRIYELQGTSYRRHKKTWLESVGLGLRLWEGTFERCTGIWLRWCDRDGQVIPTGAEARDLERQRADGERTLRQAAEAELAQLRAKSNGSRKKK